MPLVISGATSGQTTIQSTDAVTATITLPSTSGTVVVNNGAQTIEFADGSASTPSITNSGDTNTGMFFPAADTIAFTEGGVEAMRIDSSGSLLVGTTSALQSSQLTVYASPTPITTIDRTTNIGATVTCASSGTGYIQGGVRLGAEGNSGIYGYDDGTGGAQGIGIFTGNNTTIAERMRIDSAGNVGIGTTVPTSLLHLSTNSATAAGQYNSPSTLTLKNTNGSASVGGTIVFGADSNLTGAGYGASIYYSNISSSPSGTLGDLVFATKSAIATTTVTERMRIDSSGNLLVGTTSSGYVCRVQAVTTGNADVYLAKVDNIAAAPYVAWSATTSGNPYFALFLTDATVTRGSITYNRAGGLTVYNTTSDYRAKTVNGVVENALEKVALLKPCTGRMNGATEDIDFFVAHELQEVVPSAVTGEKDAVKEDGTPDYQMVDKSAIIPLLTAAIQEQQALITSLTARLDTQAEQIKALQGAK